MKVYRVFIIVLFVLVVGAGFPYECRAEDTSVSMELRTALADSRLGYETIYGPYPSAEEACAASSGIMASVDAPSYFLSDYLYVQNQIVTDGNLYYVRATIKQYRSGIDDVDWASVAGGFPIDGYTKLEKIAWIYQWVCENFSYSLGESRTLSECLSSGNAKCDEYAIIFAKLLEQFDIDCRCVDGITSDKSAGHMWNMVKVGNLWYYCDVCEDDMYGSFDLFLRGSEDDAFLLNHSAYMAGYRVCNGTGDFGGYRIAKENYFYFTQAIDEEKISLSDALGVANKDAKKASMESVLLGDGVYSKKGKYIYTDGECGVCFGRVRDEDGFMRRYLIYIY